MSSAARSPLTDASTHARGPRSVGETRSSFIRARLASILGFVPLGVWTFIHLWNNLAAFQGPDAWQAAVTEYPHPIAEAFTGIIVLLPLALHVVWGLGRLASSRPNNVRYGFYTNLKYALQRLSAIGVLFFLGAHLWLALIKPRLFEGHAEPFSEIAQQMHFHGPTLATYLLGTLGVSYHLANGTQTLCMTWGIVTSRRGLARLEWLAIGLFLVLLAMSWGAVYALWAGGAPS
jgi:succinate dehydrogenase / fumarate reductase cytochrome b subunit